ncbi:MAG: dihydroxy-acid dehydratase, partial [Lentisphaeria bacterium]|nr:dihydroxy-acid dehydratase [Lentisphaeria bacterium]
DGRFSGFSSGPCIGHIGPEAVTGGPVGKLLDGDIVELLIDNINMSGSLNLIAEADTDESNWSIENGDAILAARKPREDLAIDPKLPDSVKLWGLLQETGGGTWGGCVTDVNVLTEKLN